MIPNDSAILQNPKWSHFTPDALYRVGARHDSGARFDANETAAFARALEYIESKVYEVQYPEFMGRQLAPAKTDVPNGAESWTWSQYDMFGEARIIRDWSKDFVNVDIQGAQLNARIQSIGDSYTYTLQEMRGAAFMGLPLDTLKASSARRAIEFKLDALIAKGDTPTGLVGLLNSANVPVLAAATDTSSQTTWTAKLNEATPNVSGVLTDVNKMQAQIVGATKGLYRPDTLVLGTTNWTKLATTARSPLYTGDSVLQFILSQSPWLKSVEYWPQLDTAAANGTSERVFMYKRDPEVVQLILPQDFEQFAPIIEGPIFKTQCHLRTGGVTFYRPFAGCYMDGAA